MVTLVGTFTLPDGTPDTGSVRVSLASAAVLRDAPIEMVTAGDLTCVLDEHGQVTFDVYASDDPLWATEDPVPYLVKVRTSLRRDFHALIPTSVADADIADLVALDGPPDVVAVPGPAPVITVDPDDVTAVGLAEGTDPTVEIVLSERNPGEYALSAEFGIPGGAAGDKGDTGLTGPAPTIETGTTTTSTLDPEMPATASFEVVQLGPSAYAIDVAVGLPRGMPGVLGAYQAKDAHYIVADADGTVAVDTSGGAVTLILPSAAANDGKALALLKTAGDGVFTAQCSGGDVFIPADGQKTSLQMPPRSTHGTVLLVSTGQGWRVVQGEASSTTDGYRAWQFAHALADKGHLATSGWLLDHFNTGLRSVASALTPGSGITINFAYLQRTDWLVTLSADVSFGGSSTALEVPLFALPAGYAPPSVPIRDTQAGSIDMIPEMRHLLLRSSNVSLYGATSGKRYRFATSFHTSDPIPDTVIGSLIGSAIPSL